MSREFSSEKIETTLSSHKLLSLLKAAFEKNAAFQIRVTGISMQPMIKHGDVVRVVPESSPKLGMVVACLVPENKFVIHRIMKIEKSAFLIRGDNAPCADGWIDSTEIFGRVVSVINARGQKNIYHGKFIPLLYAVSIPTFARKWGIKLFFLMRDLLHV